MNSHTGKFAKYIIPGLWLFLALSSCNSTKFLEVDQFLLTDNDIKFYKAENVENKRSLRYDLSTLYKQKENSNFFFIPREWIYLKTQDPDDTTKFDRWKLRVLAEPPAIYDPALADATAEAMVNYLQFQGYYQAEVFPEDEVRKKKVGVTYYVTPGPLYTVDSAFFFSEDPRINLILEEIREETQFARGTPLTGQLYEKEKERISRYLRNHGFASFFPTFFAPLEADTTQKLHQANIYLEVLPPFEDTSHQVFYVGDISIYPNFDPTLEPSVLRDTIIDGFTFYWDGGEFLVKPQAIIDGIYLRPGERFSQDDFDKTNQQLSTFGIYKYVRIKQIQDSISANKLNFRIELTLNKKMEIGLDFELNYTNRSTSAGNNLIGLSASPSLRNRNVFRGAELLVSDLSTGIEVNIDQLDNPSNFFNTVDIRLQSDLYFPKFTDYLGLYRGMHNTRFGKKGRLLGDRFYALLREKAATRLSASYNFLKLLQYYEINSFNATYGFEVQRANTHRYIFNHIGIDLLLTSNDELFQDIQDRNPFLQRSFGSQLFVSLLFRDFTFIRNSRPNRFGESNYFRANVEMAGAEIWAANAIYNSFALNPDTLQLALRDTAALDFAQYLKLEVDGRYYKQYTPDRSLAARATIGIARPFGYTTDVPYVKQFFAGGPNSIRAWPARGLGPGGYLDTLTQDPDNRLLLYQTGDLKLEFNLEYRFEVFWRLKGALFLDVGNIWTLREDASRPGSQFLFREKQYLDNDGNLIVNDPFYKQLAVGGGFGFRFDFTYFLFRIDLGLPLRSPFPFQQVLDGGNAPPSARQERAYWFHEFRPVPGNDRLEAGFQLSDLTLSLGLGYPF